MKRDDHDISILSADRAAEIAMRITSYPDDWPVLAAEAALFLRTSPRTLERWRSEGFGPPYLQDPPRPGSAHRGNQPVKYLMSDLRAYLRSTRVENVMEASERNRRLLQESQRAVRQNKLGKESS